MPWANATDRAILKHRYVDSVGPAFGIETYDAALVDGRHRVVVALKLLNHLKPDSVLFFHDFWARYKAYKRVLDFYDVIGYARSLAVLRPKNSTALPRDWQTAYATG